MILLVIYLRQDKEIRFFIKLLSNLCNAFGSKQTARLSTKFPRNPPTHLLK